MTIAPPNFMQELVVAFSHEVAMGKTPTAPEGCPPFDPMPLPYEPVSLPRGVPLQPQGQGRGQ